MKNNYPVKLGKISTKVSTALSRPDLENREVLLGKSNVEHMKSSHPNDFDKYHAHISNILNNPDYACINPKDNSIELVKEFFIDEEFIKLAVRISSSGILYARSLYKLNPTRVRNYISRGILKKI